MASLILPFAVLYLLALGLPGTLPAQEAPDGGPPIREAVVPGLSQLAMASLDQSGRPVIYLNPKLTQDLVVYQFIRLHEYGHHRLGHVMPERVRYVQTNPFSQLWIKRTMEREADCYAANVMGKQSRSSVEYIAQFFEARQGMSQKDLLHPDGFERAAIIRKCADLP